MNPGTGWGSTTTERPVLSAVEIKALKTAHDIYAYQSEEGEFFLRAVRRTSLSERERDPWADDKAVRINCEGRVDVYDSDAGIDFERREMVKSCYASISLYRGWAHILRAGDTLRLVFSAGGHSNEYARNGGVVCDSLRIVVIRAKDVNGRNPLEFLVDVDCTTPDSLARMVRFQ